MKTMIKQESIVVAADDMTSADLDGEAVILDLKSGKYYGLNEVGARIFELAQEPRTVGEIVGVVVQEYDVDAEQAENDLVAFLQDMVDQQLIRVKNEAVA